MIIKNLYKSYIKNGKEIKIINDLNYEFKKGTIYLIMGKSGAGKTTLINILGLLCKPDKGEIIINDKNVQVSKESSKSIIRNKEIGMVFQDYYLHPNLNAYENILLPMIINKEIVDKEKQANNLLKKVGLYDRKNHYPNELSGGEQQRVAIARALANNPSILLCDEPTGALDNETEREILELITSQKNKDKCIIIVSHNMNVKKYADVILKLEKGKLIEYEK